MEAMTAGWLDLSMNEVEMMSYKAARGAGASWGHAEEIGKAARWLARTGDWWAASLLDALADKVAIEGPPSPFGIGMRLADGMDPSTPGALHVVKPIWLIAMLAVLLPPGRGVRLTADGMIAAITRGTVRTSCALADWAGRPAVTLTLEAIDHDESYLPFSVNADNTRALIEAADFEVLEALVYRTYVPESEQSRVRGAGASK